MRIWLVGPQGCGKGTIGEKLAEHFNIPLISAGQLCREVSPRDPDYGVIQSHLSKGELVPQSITARLVRDRVSSGDCVSGFVMDGWGRRLSDIQAFDPEFDVVVNLQISPETSVSRLSGRRTCTNCGSVFNIVTVKPKIDGKCDKCGGKIVQRDDDTESAIMRRLEIYHTETQEVIDYYKTKGILAEVEAESMPDKVFVDVLRAIEPFIR